MDRFKFRIWDKENQKYHNGMEVFDYMRGVLSPDKYVMEQSTGLKDKNGKLVYEGDIVAEVYSGLIDRPGVVKYGEFNCSCCDGVYGWYIDGGDIRRFEENYDRCVIIGNIHENADLLGEE